MAINVCIINRKVEVVLHIHMFERYLAKMLIEPFDINKKDDGS